MSFSFFLLYDRLDTSVKQMDVLPVHNIVVSVYSAGTMSKCKIIVIPIV